jgi:hypothetical protein
MCLDKGQKSIHVMNLSERFVDTSAFDRTKARAKRK